MVKHLRRRKGAGLKPLGAFPFPASPAPSQSLLTSCFESFIIAAEVEMGVSKIGGKSPKSMVYNGKIICGGTVIFGNTQMNMEWIASIFVETLDNFD